MMAAAVFTITAYCTGHTTASGTTPVAGHVIAADTRVLPMGSIVHIAGVGERKPVEKVIG